MAREALPDDAIDMVMGKLALTYGKRFTNGYDVSPELVREHWAHELAGLSLESIAYALARLPSEYVPNVLQLRILATQRPAGEFKALPAPQASPEVRSEQLQALQGLREAFLKTKKHVDIAWAQRIAASPERYSWYARKLAAEVLQARERMQ